LPVVKCGVPSASVLDSHWIQTAYFQDSYRVPLSRPRAGVIDIFLALFGHHPLWVKLLLVVRNRIATFCGLAAPTAAEMMSTEIKSSYSVGDKIGVWPIFTLTENELIAGRDNKHLDFRLSVLREANGAAASVTVSTLCAVHNTAGRIYLFFIIPFHKWGVQRMLAKAVSEGRL
jgi:Protein of unknown function (DUF2867)